MTGTARADRIGGCRGVMRLHALACWLAPVFALGLAGKAAGAPATVGLGVGYDVPAVPISEELSIDRGDPLGVTLTVPVIVGWLRVEPQLAWTSLRRGYGVPPAGEEDCPGLMDCWAEAGETQRTLLALAVGPAWSIGSRARIWAGPWSGLTFRDTSDGVRRDWSLGATVGGEFFLADHISFGLDVRGTYTSVDAGGPLTRTRYRDLGGLHTEVEFARGWTAGVDGVAAFRLYVN